MPDVDLDDVAQKIFFGAFFNSAQICVATKRLYVHERIYDGLRDRPAAIAKAVKPGHGSEQDTVLGRFHNRRRYDPVTSLTAHPKAGRVTLDEGRGGHGGGGNCMPGTTAGRPEDTLEG